MTTKGSKIVYVWMNKNYPDLGLKRGDHVLVEEVVSEHGHVQFLYQTEDGSLFAFYPSEVIEHRFDAIAVRVMESDAGTWFAWAMIASALIIIVTACIKWAA